MPTESRLVELRDALVRDFKQFIPDMRSVEAHFGPFDLDELKAFSLKAPAIRVSILGGPLDAVSTREQDVRLQCAAYIVTRPLAASGADVIALRIAEALVERISARSFTRWSEPGTQLQLDNHYSGAVREAGSIALFSLAWQTVVRVGRNVAYERLMADGTPEETTP
ncbi:MAG: hypothetical protein KDJ37_08850 [Hyphomicrobiaceae bacterium]|nr:hypothetical protein [Hyphomicrobiaceae bacterium]